MSSSTTSEVYSSSSDKESYFLPRSRYLRAKLLEEVFTDVSIFDKDLAQALTRTHQQLGALQSSQLGIQSDSVENCGGHQEPGFQLTDSIYDCLLNEIDMKISAVSNFCQGSRAESARSEEENDLPQALQDLLEGIASSKTELEDASSDVRELVASMNELHAQLHSELLEALSNIPPKLNEKRSATNDLLSATIEASLVKLSLMRARLHQTLYGFTSPTDPSATMSTALSTAYEKLKDEESDLLDEERALDIQLEEYRRLMQMAGGNRTSGFGQVVEDWMRVQKEIEECKRDLRRLGWTED